jgi:aarF domain-containing kinase
MYWQAPLVGYIVGCTWYTVVPTAQCEAGVVTPTMTLDKPTSNTDDQTVSHQIRRALRMVRRILKLMVALTPVAALYPIQYLFPTRISDDTMDAQDALLAQAGLPNGPAGWYYKLCLYCVEWSGAAAIKMMQWAGSRPDMFGREFCAVFSQLQDDTTPHAWKYTERAMRRAYGEDWQDRIQLHEILGSGCIAQVYKGNVLDKDGKGQEVAIKGSYWIVTISCVRDIHMWWSVSQLTAFVAFVILLIYIAMHPNVEEDIEADLDLMRLGVKIIDNLPFHLFQTMKWLNFPGMVEEIAEMLQIQLDMRQEAIHLVQFNENFKDDEIVVFPKVRDSE